MKYRRVDSKVFIMLLILSIHFAVSTVAAETWKPVQGRGCHTYSDDETPNMAEAKAKSEAKQEAVSSHAVRIESFTEVVNFQLKQDIIQSATVGLLHDLRWGDVEWNGREACIELHAKLDVQSIQEELERRVSARKISERVQAPDLSFKGNFNLEIKLNKTDGKYKEGEELQVYVKSDEDVYLKLDYFQADGTVVHMVPNLFNGQTLIKKGVPYTFGGKDSPARFVISGPFGDEVIKAFASKTPFPESVKSATAVSKSDVYLPTLERGLSVGPRRGVTIESRASASASLSTISKAVWEQQDALKP